MSHQDTSYIEWDDVCFLDSETRSAPGQDREEWADVTETSTRRYAVNAWPIIITYGFGIEGEVHRWELSDITNPDLVAEEFPEDLLEWDGLFAAYNSGFDRNILDRHLKAGVEGWLDMMAQAAASGLPFGLDRAAKACGHEGKKSAGKKLIRQFCSADGDTPESHPEDWAAFCEYADVDVIAMQHVAASTLPLPRWQWEEFWASEHINDRGLPMDAAMLDGGAALAAAYDEEVADRIKAVSDGEMYSPRQYIKQREWVWERIRGNARVAEMMIKAHRQHPDTGEDEYKFKMDRPVIEKMLAVLEAQNDDAGLTDDEWDVLQFLRIREFGASATPGKFKKAAAALMPDGTLPGQYVFNGAAQTGRYSSRGVQVHNLTNKIVSYEGSPEDRYGRECDLAEYMADIGCGHEEPDLEFIEENWGDAGMAMSRMIRPAITAPEGKVICWGDWSNIEARVLPWLALAERRLDIFRRIDADPENEPDVYLQAAGGMYSLDPHELLKKYRAKDPKAKPLRQRGKIAELALGFAGGAGALQSMAAGYGMVFEGDEAQDIVDRWRKANAWAVEFWDQVWDAFTSAVRNPGEIYEAGRVAYQAIEYMGRVSVVCFLPDGRPLVYRNVRMKTFIEYDEFEPTVVVEKRDNLVFDGPEGAKKLWKGLLVENITQGTAASVLRWTTRSLRKEEDVQPVVGHTHDEILTLIDEGDEEEGKERLQAYMVQDYGWNEGLPTAADVLCNVCYTKALDD